MPKYYDMDGLPLDALTWSLQLECRRPGRGIIQTHLANGYVVSTVWLGIDHSFGRGPPLIFETMVFKEGSSTDLDCERYSTKKEAAEGHNRIVHKWRMKKLASKRRL